MVSSCRPTPVHWSATIHRRRCGPAPLGGALRRLQRHRRADRSISGDVKRHRLDQSGNRQLNSVIHIAAVTQVRHHGPGRAYLQRNAERQTNGEAMRALKRQLSDVIYRRCSPTSGDVRRPGVDKRERDSRPRDRLTSLAPVLGSSHTPDHHQRYIPDRGHGTRDPNPPRVA
jgi:hypothetical protein